MKKNLNSPNSLGSAQGELPQSTVVFWVLDQLRLHREKKAPRRKKENVPHQGLHQEGLPQRLKKDLFVLQTSPRIDYTHTHTHRDERLRKIIPKIY
jgi:hypothetical protein